MPLEKEFHIKLKQIIKKHLKDTGFAIKEEERVKNVIFDILAEKGDKRLFFECEVPSMYRKFLSFKNSEKELLKLAFSPQRFIYKCVNKASKVVKKTGIIPIIAVPSDFFPEFLKKGFLKNNLSVWLINLETQKIAKLKTNKKFKIKEEGRAVRSPIDFIIKYFFSNYELGEARERLDRIVKKCVRDKMFFEKLMKYYENRDFEKLIRHIEKQR